MRLHDNRIFFKIFNIVDGAVELWRMPSLVCLNVDTQLPVIISRQPSCQSWISISYVVLQSMVILSSFFYMKCDPKGLCREFWTEKCYQPFDYFLIKIWVSPVWKDFNINPNINPFFCKRWSGPSPYLINAIWKYPAVGSCCTDDEYFVATHYKYSTKEQCNKSSAIGRCSSFFSLMEESCNPKKEQSVNHLLHL